MIRLRIGIGLLETRAVSMGISWVANEESDNVFKFYSCCGRIVEW